MLSRAGVLAFRDGAGVIDQGADWLVFQLSAKTEADNTGVRSAKMAPSDARKRANLRPARLPPPSSDGNVTTTHRGGVGSVLERSIDAEMGKLPRGTDLCREDGPGGTSDMDLRREI